MFPTRNSSTVPQRRPGGQYRSAQFSTDGALARRVAPARATRLDSAPAIFSDPNVPKPAADLWLWMVETYPSSKTEGKCWPAVPTVATDYGLSERQVQRRLRQLERAKWLTVKPRCYRTNEYVFRTPSDEDQEDKRPDDCNRVTSNVTGDVTPDVTIGSSFGRTRASLREERTSQPGWGDAPPSKPTPEEKTTPPEKQHLIDRWDEFLNQWPQHNRRGVDFGCRTWISLIDAGVITAANIHEVFEGLGRWKNSAQWQKNGGQYIPAIANMKGEGWLQVRAWKDLPPQRQEGDEW
jgi:hypothetical protein